MSTQITIDETGADTVVVTLDGTPGPDGVPGAGITGHAVLAPSIDNPTLTATPNTLHVIDVVNTAVTLLLPAGTPAGTQVGVIRHNSEPTALTDFVAIEAAAGATLHGDPVALYGEGQAATFFHVGGDAWWLVSGGDLPDNSNMNEQNSVVRRDNNGRIQSVDPEFETDVATMGWVEGRALNSVGLRSIGYIGHTETANGLQIDPAGGATRVYGNPANITADAGSFIPTRDCLIDFELDVTLIATGSSAGRLRLDFVRDGVTTTIVNNKRFHFHGAVGPRIFTVHGMVPGVTGDRCWFLLYIGLDGGVAATYCIEVDYQYTEIAP
jgi:hypothetical protein